MYWSVKRPRNLKGVNPVAGRENGVPTLRQAFGGKIQESFLIIHQQDSSCPHRSLRRILLWNGRDGGFGWFGQKDFECGAFSRFGIDDQTTPSLFNHAENSPETQP